MHKIEANEIVGTTFYTINKIREFKNGGDMLILYFAYIEQSRIQETNQSRSLDIFMMKKMGWGEDKFRKAKNGLKELGLIDVVQVRGVDGKVQTWYVKTNFIINEQKLRTQTITHEIELSTTPENQNLEKPDPGKTGTNALSNKHKCLKNIKENITEDVFLQKQKEKEDYIKKRKEHLTNAFDYWNSITHIKKGKGLPKCTKITKDIEEAWNKIYDRYDKEDIAKAFDRYISEIEGRIDNGGTYYSHRFSFYEFISRSTGLKKFINS